MRRVSPVVIASAALVIAVTVAACTDRSASTEPAQQFTRGVATTLATCPSAAELEATVNTVFIEGSPNAQSALGKLNNMVKQYTNGDIAGAQDQARNIIRFLRLKWSELAHQELIPGLIDGLECFTGITTDSYIVVPTGETQTLVTDAGSAGMQLPPNAVSEPTLVTFDVLPAPPALPGDFMLDVYDRFVNVTQESGVANALLVNVTVAVCPNLPVGMSDEAKNHLRLGHWKSAAFETAGFEVTPRAADVSFMPCAITPTGDTGSGWMGSLLRTVRSYFAGEAELFSGGVGGTAGSFSPFGVVDDQLLLSGGVGGTAGSFLRAAPDETDAAPDATRVQAPVTETSKQWTRRAPATATAGEGVILFQTAGECTTGVVATAVSPECRPGLKLTTRLGKPVVGVSVTFTIGEGGGKTALEPCDGAIDAVAVTATTNEFGKAGACWTLGAKGTNTITAAVTGGLPVGVHLTQDLLTWTMTAKAPTVTTVTCEPTVLPYTGADLAPCKAETSDGASVVTPTPVVVYENNRNVGIATATATFAGDAVHNASSGTATFEITKAPSTTTVSFEPGPYEYRASAFTATAAVSGAGGVTGTAVITYSGNCLNVTVPNGCTATAAYAGDPNHEASADTLSITIEPKPATIRAQNADMTYGDAIPALTAEITGLLGADVLNFTLSTTASATSGAGTYPINVSLGTNPNYAVTAAPATLTVLKRPLTATAGSGSMLLNGPMPTMPCVVTNLAADVSPKCTTVVGLPLMPGTNITTPQVEPLNPANYTWANLIPGTLQVNFVQVGCFSSPIYSVMPPTKSAQRKGSNVPVKCGLFDANGTAVVTATGDLRVEDRGIDSLTAPTKEGTQAFPDDLTTPWGLNVFSVSKGGNYSFGLDTSSPKFEAGHYYYVIARWSDGSRTMGWFLLK